jgi:hypothetical protein
MLACSFYVTLEYLSFYSEAITLREVCWPWIVTYCSLSSQMWNNVMACLILDIICNLFIYWLKLCAALLSKRYSCICTNYEGISGSWGTGPPILNLKTWPLYHWGKECQYPLNRRVSGPHSQSGRFGEQKEFLTLQGFEPWTVQPTVSSLYELH